MKHTISPDRTKLTIHVDLTINVDLPERAELRHWNDNDKPITSDAAMIEFLEPLTCNSELEWIDPRDTGDLTDAPILGIIEDSDGNPRVVERWVFMDYQVRSVLEDLRDTGECVFVGGALTK